MGFVKKTTRAARVSAGAKDVAPPAAHIKITRPGPVGIAFFALLIGILALAGIALLVGAALVGIAAGAVLIFGGILSSLSRRPFRR